MKEKLSDSLTLRKVISYVLPSFIGVVAILGMGALVWNGLLQPAEYILIFIALAFIVGFFGLSLAFFLHFLIK